MSSLRRLLRTGLGLGSGRSLRRGLADLHGLRIAVEAQNQLLEALVRGLYGELRGDSPEMTPEQIAAQPDATAQQGSVDHLDPVELSIALAYEARVHAATGKRPSEDQILAYLADEKTQAQHATLNAEIHAGRSRSRGPYK